MFIRVENHYFVLKMHFHKIGTHKCSFSEHPKMCALSDQNFTKTLPRSRFDVSYVRKPIIFAQNTLCAILHFIPLIQ